MLLSADKWHYFPQIPDLSLGWLVGRSGHCTVSGPSGDGVSGTPSGLGDSAACCSSVRGCSSIQLANTSMVWESRSPATSGRDDREVKKKKKKRSRSIAPVSPSAALPIYDGYDQEIIMHLCATSSGCHTCSDNTKCVTSVKSLVKEGLNFK